MKKIVIQEKFALFSDHWSPKIVTDLNDSYIKFAKLKGEFVWHQHEHEDELFLIIAGILTIKFRDSDITLKPGEMIVIPKGVEHKPVCEEEVQVILIEPKSTLNTGNIINDDKTRLELERI
jgi:mannose-6-phosphate isomerase-like protein (cupin superfamily)